MLGVGGYQYNKTPSIFWKVIEFNGGNEMRSRASIRLVPGITPGCQGGAYGPTPHQQQLTLVPATEVPAMI